MGGNIVEFTLVFPIFIIVALGTVDVGFMLSEWAQANKATYVGAHRAIVSNPVAPGLTTVFDDTIIGGMGLRCADPLQATRVGYCMTFPNIDCTSTAHATAQRTHVHTKHYGMTRSLYWHLYANAAGISSSTARECDDFLSARSQSEQPGI